MESPEGELKRPIPVATLFVEKRRHDWVLSLNGVRHSLGSAQMRMLVDMVIEAHQELVAASEEPMVG